MGHRRAAKAVVAATALAALTATASACGGDPGRPTVGSLTPTTGTVASPTTTVGPATPRSGAALVLLPPAAGPTLRWQAVHRTQLGVALRRAGLDPSTVNVDGEDAATAAIAAAPRGVVVVLAGLAPAVGSAAAQAAHASGRRVLAYYRAVPGADAFVGSNPAAAGTVAGDALLDCLQRTGVAKPKVVVLGGPSEAPATAVAEAGLRARLDRAFGEGQAVKVGDQSVASASAADAAFTALLAAAGARVDAVASADDEVAGAVAQVLRRNGLSVPVSGVGGGLDALRRVLIGEQCVTVGESAAAEAAAGGLAAADLAAGRSPTGAVAASADTGGAPAVLVSPLAVTRASLAGLVATGQVTASELCDGLADRCAAAGISSS